jgi:4-hydroxybenzoate polyprenyltransferase
METPLKKTLSGLTKLTRFNEFGYFIVITTLLGIASAKGAFSERMAAILLANWLAVSFAYMVNDIEDAPDDAFSAKNSQRNPISKGMLSPKTARTAATLVGLLAIALYALMGLWTFIFGLTCLLLGAMYSVKIIRLKSIAILDVISHGLILAGLPFLSGFFTFTTTLNRTWIWPFLFVIFVSVFYNHYNQHKGDAEHLTRLRQTGALYGERSANTMMTVIIFMVVSTGIISLFLIDLVPAWVVIAISALVVVFFVPVYLKTRKSKANELMPGFLINTLERSAAIGLMLQFLIPWMVQFINSRWL